MPLRRDLLFFVLAGLCLLHVAWLAPRLLVSDLNLDYPFMDGDSWDWIANGLAFAGADVRYSGRPPLVPLLLALLDRAGALSLFPLVNVALFHAALLALYRTTARLCGARAAAVATLVLLVSHALQTLALQVMADVLAAVLLVVAFALFVRAESRPRADPWAGLALGLSTLAQPAALLALPPAVLARVAARRLSPGARPQRSSLPALAVVLALLPQGLWTAVKLAAFGTAGDLLARHTHLLRVHTDAVGHYAYGFFALLGPPAALAVLAGAGLALHRPRSAPHLAALGFAAGLAAFFVLLYDFNAQRFLVYALAPLGLFLAEALARLRRPAVWAGATLLCLIGSALPRPAPGNDGSWIALWPLPPLYLHGAMQPAPTGSATLRLATVRPVVLPVADLLHSSVWAQVAALARTPLPPPSPWSPRAFAADRSAVYLASPTEMAQRYRIVTRWGNALRKRVVLVPRDHLAPALGPLGLTPLETVVRGVGEAGEVALFRARLPGAAGTWLLAVGHGLGEARQPDLAPRAPAPLTPVLQSGLDRARAIQRFLAGSDSYVGILACDARRDAAQLYLPFLLDTTEVHFVAAPDLARTRPLLAGAPLLGERRFGPTLVQRTRIFGRPSGLISCADRPR